MKTRIITAVVGILVLIGVLFTFDTMIFNLVIAAITLIAIHEIYMALGFEKKDWLLYAVTVPYTLLIMLSSYSVWRALVMPVLEAESPSSSFISFWSLGSSAARSPRNLMRMLRSL